MAPVTWNNAGEGFPEIVHSITVGAGTPQPPTGLNIISTDPTTIHMTWEGSSDAGGYQIWSRNVNNASSISSRAGHVDVTCADVNWLFPGTWNYEWCISAYNGNAESEKGPCVIPPSPSASAAAVTCPPGPVWCPNGDGGASGPTSTTLPPGSGPTSTSTGTNLPTGSNMPGAVVTNGQCKGPDCDSDHCTGILCVSVGCSGNDCFNGVCTGVNCIVLGCIGPAPAQSVAAVRELDAPVADQVARADKTTAIRLHVP